MTVANAFDKKFFFFHCKHSFYSHVTHNSSHNGLMDVRSFLVSIIVPSLPTLNDLQAMKEQLVTLAEGDDSVIRTHLLTTRCWFDAAGAGTEKHLETSRAIKQLLFGIF